MLGVENLAWLSACSLRCLFQWLTSVWSDSVLLIFLPLFGRRNLYSGTRSQVSYPRKQADFYAFEAQNNFTEVREAFCVSKTFGWRRSLSIYFVSCHCFVSGQQAAVTVSVEPAKL